MNNKQNNRQSTRVFVGMSGGVDSSVAACLLKEAGYQVAGITMKIWDGSVAVGNVTRDACYSPHEDQDIALSAKICDQLGIRHHVIDLSKDYKKIVLEYFRKEYLSGRTPNPCVRCNQRVKFGLLLDRARESGLEFDFFATGHYAQTELLPSGQTALKRGADHSKDQSYFLYALSSDELKKILFPIGHLKKTEVRALAEARGLPTAQRAESQDFIAGGDYSGLFQPGEIVCGDLVDEQGKIVGTHQGIVHYTIGQRKGLSGGQPEPLYVTRINQEKNQIIVGSKDKLYSSGLIATEVNLLYSNGDDPFSVMAKIRQQHPGTSAKLFKGEGRKIRVEFQEPQMSVTPGQSVVFYDQEIVVGGGVIESIIPEH